MIGQTIGPYHVLAKLGEGGMGEVYRARDTRLNRDVAVKVLPAAFAAEPDRLARFSREAQVLASLNHPNVGAIHGMEQTDGRYALILELVEGPTLAERIAQGAVPVDEALPIARQIAEALEAAHEQGIVHRDLKPANVKLRFDGTVKVLDFGLAKSLATAAASGTSSVTVAADVTSSPTFAASTPLMTGVGMLLGTAAYMAPEQARGRPVDRRADLWAFGCVLYEMLTGRRPFGGNDVTETLASILRDEPDWTALPDSTPPSIRRLLRRCLQKDPRDRLQSAGDARIEIVEALTSGSAAAAISAPARRTHISRMVPVTAAGLSALLAGILVWTLKPAPPVDVHVTRTLLAVDPFDQRPPAAPDVTRARVARPDRTAIAISPDGRTVVFRAAPGGAGGPQLFVRPLDSLKAAAITTTTGAESPFFSPDGAWLAYWDNGELRRVPAASGSSAFSTIARVPEGDRIEGASWGQDDRIVFATPAAVWSVAAAGGTPTRLTEWRDDAYGHRFPQMLPGTNALLFTRQNTVFRWDDAQVVVRALPSGDDKVLLDDAADARYVASGHLVFVRRGKLMAVPFDPQRLELTGAAVAVADDVMQAANIGNSSADSGAGQFAISPTGTLVYATGGIAPDDPRELDWVDRSGAIERFGDAPTMEYASPRISPDGSQVIMATQPSASGEGNRLWTYDIARHTLVAFTNRQELGMWPIWSPDGKRIAFNSLAAGGALTVKSADGTGASDSIKDVGGVAAAWSPSGQVAFITNGDIWVVDMTVPGHPKRVVVQTPAIESHPAFSPDGKWLAYTSAESGRIEVYVQPYPGPGARVLIAGGAGAAWRGDGRELYYYTAMDGVVTMMAVTVDTAAERVSVGQPRKLFEDRFVVSTPARAYDVTADGKRFVMVRRLDAPQPPPVHLVLVEHALEEIQRLAPRQR